MSKIDELPAAPFFDAIREWNAMVENNLAEFRKKAGFDLPDGHIPVSATFARLWREAIEETEK